MRKRKSKTSTVAECEKALGGSPLGKDSKAPLLSTGSTLLNLACAGDPMGGFLPGKYILLVGDAAAGKTFLAITVLAEACRNPDYAEYRLIYDNVEDGCLLDLPRLFNQAVANRIASPCRGENGDSIYSSTVEEFYFNVDDAVKRGIPFIYVLDSMDALTCDAEVVKFDEKKKASRLGKPVSGSYGVDKARRNSEYLRKVLPGLRATGSILIILAQTRDDLGFGFAKKTRSGGHSLRFYATTEIWMSISGVVKKHIKGKDRQVGVKVKLRVRKNRVTGKLSEMNLEIFPSYGIDDLGSCIDYLVDEGWWEIQKQTITATGLDLVGTRDKLIAQIEEAGLETNVSEMVGECWSAIDKAGDLKRKGRYEMASD